MKTLTQKIGNISTARRKRVEARRRPLSLRKVTPQELREGP